MPQTIIPDILPLTQAIALGGQTLYSTTWTADYSSDVVVYSRPANTPANDATQILNSSQYSVAFIGDQQIVQVTLVTPSTLGDVVTITRMTPADRLNLYTNTNFTPTMLNQDFGILTLVDQQAQLVNQQVAPRYNYSAFIQPVIDTILPILPANNTWIKNSGNTAIIAYPLPSGGVAPATDTYVLLTPDSVNLPNSFSLSTLTGGLLINNPAGPNLLSTIITGQSQQISIAGGNGLSGPINISIASNPIIPGTAGMGIPIGTSAQRVTPLSNIGLRFNTNLNELEYWNGSTWIQLNPAGSSAENFITDSGTAIPSSGSITISGGSTGLTTTGSGSTVSMTGILKLAFGGSNANLTASNGGIVYSGASALAILAGTSSANQILVSGSNSAPSWSGLSALMDTILGSTQGDVLYRNSTVWTVLSPGTSGYFLQTQGSSSNPQWAAGNSGTVTSIATNNGLTGGVITTTGTLGLAAITNNTLLANISGGSLYPSSTTLTALIDATLGSTQGDILYRNSSVWTVLAPGSSGQVLQSGGAAANPSWTSVVITENYTNSLLLMGG